MANVQKKKIPVSLYKRIHEVIPIPCVDIVLKNDHSFLLAKRINKPAQGSWWLPGGRIIKGEKLIEAANRKAQEELGISVRVEKILGVDETMFPDGPFNDSTHTINVVFLASFTHSIKSVKLDNQNDEYAWFSHIEKTWDPYVKKFLALAGFTEKI